MRNVVSSVNVLMLSVVRDKCALCDVMMRKCVNAFNDVVTKCKPTFVSPLIISYAIITSLDMNLRLD